MWKVKDANLEIKFVKQYYCFEQEKKAKKQQPKNRKTSFLLFENKTTKNKLNKTKKKTINKTIRRRFIDIFDKLVFCANATHKVKQGRKWKENFTLLCCEMEKDREGEKHRADRSPF